MKLLQQIYCLFRGHSLILQAHKRNQSTRHVKCLLCGDIWPIYK